MLRPLALVLALPATLTAQDPVRRQVDSLHAAMVAAFASEPASTARFYADDAAVVGGRMRVTGRADVDAYWKSIPPGATWKLDVLDVGGSAEVPWVHGRSTLTSASGRVSLTEYIGLLQRGADGQLRFRTDAYAFGDGKASPGDEAAIRHLDSLWAHLYAAHDTASAQQLYAESLAFRGVNGTIKTRADEMRDIRPSPGLTMDYFRTVPTTVKTFDRVAVVSGSAEWSFTTNGKSSHYGFPYTAVYARGGPLGWQIIALHMGEGRARGR